MRIGTFLLGGLVGAAAVIYLSDKKNRSMMMSMVASPTDALGKMLSKTTGKATDAVMSAMAIGAGLGKSKSDWNETGSTSGVTGAGGFKSMAGATGTAGTSGTAGTTGTTGTARTAGMSANAASGNDGLAQVEKIVNEDPELKRTVNDILSDSGKSGAQLQ